MKTVFRISLITLIFFGIYCMVLSFLENSLIYFPTRYPEGNWQPANLPFEDVWFQAEDGTKLHGWYVAHPNPRAVVLFAHGNAGNLSDRADIVRLWWAQMQVSIMIYDYRGYGRSEGKPFEEGLYQDGKAAQESLAKKAGVSPQDIILVGRSLGGGVSVETASKIGAKALILDSTFTSLPDVASHHYPWLPVKGLMKNRFDSINKIKNYQGPLLQSHGDKDSVIPFALGQKLFEAANEPKQFVSLPGADHNDFQGPAYYEILNQFLED